MSKRVHFGHFHGPYVYAYIYCKGMIETSYDWESIQSFSLSGNIKKVTCRTCISEFDEMPEESKKVIRGLNG